MATFEKLLQQLDPELEADSLALADGLWVVAPRRNEVGTAWVLRRTPGGKYKVWRIDTATDSAPPDARYFACWFPSRAENGCALFATPLAAPADGRGKPRFVLSAIVGQSAGGTMGAEVSAWTWEGERARLARVSDYAFALDHHAVRWEGGMLRIHQKESMRSVFACGTCPEPESDRAWRFNPKGVEDQGVTHQDPALELIDALYWQIQRRLPSTDLAAPPVVTFLTERIEDVSAQGKKPDAYVPLGMVNDWKARGNQVCLDSDEPGRLRFTVEQRGGKLHVTQVAEVSGETCAQVLDRAR
jgi:hypothetical protein